MMDLTYPGFTRYVAFPTDPDLVKWRAVRPLIYSPFVQTLSDGTWAAIAAMNKQINTTIHYVSDLYDEWQSPQQTLQRQTGDCEDFAILKYAIMRKSGITEDHLCLMLGEIASLSGNKPHCFAAVELNGQQRVLDSLFDQLIKPSEYINWQPRKMLSGDQCCLFFRAASLNEQLKEYKPNA